MTIQQALRKEVIAEHACAASFINAAVEEKLSEQEASIDATQQY